MEVIIVLLRLGLVLAGSLFFGLIRQKLHKPISFGTFTFVSMGACALSVISTSVQGDNPLVLVGSIVTGIGFLGAGALIRSADKTTGFTSASSIWLFAIFGVVIGLGLNWLLEKTHWIELPPDIYYIGYLPVVVNGTEITVIVALALLITFLATLYPAWRVSTRSPLDGIRYVS